MAKRRHFTVYWDEQEEGELMGKLEKVARRQKRSKSSGDMKRQGIDRWKG